MNIELQKKHELAMQCADDALLIERHIKSLQSNKEEVLKQAFLLEKEVAMSLIDTPASECEPTRSVCFRSAGYCALEAGLIDDAREMVIIGSTYVVHADIRKELEELDKTILNIQLK